MKDMTESRRQISEESAIGELLELENFRNYYNSTEMSKIKPMYWFVDPSIQTWGSAGWGKLGKKSVPIVTLQEVPVEIEHQTRIAHEVQHLLLDKEGFPRVVCTHPNSPDLTSALKSMVQDPLINLRLKSYGFDVEMDHRKMLEDYKSKLIRMPTIPTDQFTSLLFTINYVRNILRWETAFDDGHQEDNDFQQWFDERYSGSDPDIIQKGKVLLKSVRSTGYENPSQQRALFNNISGNNKQYGVRLNFLPKP